MVTKIFAPATIGNVGPGFDVLGLAVDGLGDFFEFELMKDESFIEVEGRDADLVPKDPRKNTVVMAADFLFQRYDKLHHLRVKISRQLPISGGLGASAASSVAGAMFAAKVLGIKGTAEILEAALFAESQVAGRHLDNIAPCVFGGLTVVNRVDPPQIFQCPFPGDFWFALMTPQIKLDTKKSRTLLPDSLPNQAWIQQMAHTASLMIAFMQADLQMIRASLIDGFAEPQRSLLIPGFYTAQQTAVKMGALGFTISGGGPTCFAICETKELAHEIGKASGEILGPGTTVHVGPVSKQGARFL